VKIRTNPFFPQKIEELANALGVYWRELSIYVNDLLPDQTDNAGKYLTTDGTDASWGSLPAATTLKVDDEGTTLSSNVTEFDFVGSGVTATNPSTGKITVTIPGASSGIAGVRIDEEGSQVVATATRINFIGAALTSASGGTDYATVTADPDIIMADTADVLTAGFATTSYNSGSKTSGTWTPDESHGNLQYISNDGAFTLAPPSNAGTMIVLVTNGSGAGAITTSGFTAVTGDPIDTTSGHLFIGYITKISSTSHLTWVAMQ